MVFKHSRDIAILIVYCGLIIIVHYSNLFQYFLLRVPTLVPILYVYKVPANAVPCSGNFVSMVTLDYTAHYSILIVVITLSFILP